MSNVFIELQAILAASNQAALIPPFTVNFDFENPTQPATTYFFNEFFEATTGGVAVPLPAATIFSLLIQNQSPTGILHVAVTPTGGAPQTYSYGPGGVHIYFDPLETGGGITAVTLTGVAGTIPAMVFAGA